MTIIEHALGKKLLVDFLLPICGQNCSVLARKCILMQRKPNSTNLSSCWGSATTACVTIAVLEHMQITMKEQQEKMTHIQILYMDTSSVVQELELSIRSII